MDKIIGFCGDITYREYINGFNLCREYVGGYDEDTQTENIERSLYCEISLYETDDVINDTIIDMVADHMEHIGYDVERGADVGYNSYIRKYKYITIIDENGADQTEQIADEIKTYLEKIA